MVETELKLQVPPAARRALERELSAGGRSATVRLRATYFDTADRRLARAGLALRLRQEGRRRVQALKGRGPAGDALGRFEHESVLPAAAPMAIDPARHAGTPAGERLAALLADGAPLQEVFRTDVRRRTRRVRSRAGSVELALDLGEIVAGERRLPLAELEIELLQGDPRAVLDVARRWSARHGLWPDLRTKAERGERLAAGEPAGPPRKAEAPTLDPAAGEAAAFAAIVGSCTMQALANASQVASGAFEAEHVHQLRVGLRRLRSALRLFEGFAPEGLDERVAALFRRLGAARDRDVLDASVLPALRAAGAPLAELPDEARAGDAPEAVMREPATTLLWLDLLALSQPPPATAATPGAAAGAHAGPLRAAYAARLAREHRRVRRDAKRFDDLDDAARHGLRKRAKRLRYAVEFGASLYRAKAVERYLAALRPVQEALGLLNDLQVARSVFEPLCAHDARAWFALGWLAARREAVLEQCRAALRAFRDARVFWR